MLAKRLCSTIVLILGAIIFAFGSHMSYESGLGEANLSEAEASVPGRPVIGPVRRRARNQAEMATQQKMGKAEQNVLKSQATANWLRGLGIVLFLIGLGWLVFSFFSKKRSI